VAEVQKTKQEVAVLSAVQQGTKKEVQETNHELMVLAAVQEETKHEVQETKHSGSRRWKARSTPCSRCCRAVAASRAVLAQGSGRGFGPAAEKAPARPTSRERIHVCGERINERPH
jgi:hypothetical protein